MKILLMLLAPTVLIQYTKQTEKEICNTNIVGPKGQIRCVPSIARNEEHETDKRQAERRWVPINSWEILRNRYNKNKRPPQTTKQRKVTNPPYHKGDRGSQGKRGEPGEPGRPGEPGKPGKPGPRGEQGEHGEPGRPGRPGKRGEQGEPGEPGKRGEKGEPGERGKPGEPGKPGKPGKRGKPGTEALPGEESDSPNSSESEETKAFKDKYDNESKKVMFHSKRGPIKLVKTKKNAAKDFFRYD